MWRGPSFHFLGGNCWQSQLLRSWDLLQQVSRGQPLNMCRSRQLLYNGFLVSSMYLEPCVREGNEKVIPTFLIEAEVTVLLVGQLFGGCSESNSGCPTITVYKITFFFTYQLRQLNPASSFLFGQYIPTHFLKKKYYYLKQYHFRVQIESHTVSYVWLMVTRPQSHLNSEAQGLLFFFFSNELVCMVQYW